MTDMTRWSLRAQIDWVTVGRIAPLSWETFPNLRASIVFADRARGELFSTSGMASAVIRPDDTAILATCVVEALLPSALEGYVTEGTQFLVMSGAHCVGVGAITEAKGPAGAP